jgi:Outer membrane protein beta-barrel domain
MRRLLVLSALILAAIAPASANAQDGVGELTPIIGFRAGGTLNDAVTGESFSIQPSWSWGVVAGISVGSPNLVIEATYLQQLTRGSSDTTFGGGLGGLHDMRIQTALAGVQWDFSPKARVRPLVSAAIGATSLEAQGGGQTTSFTASLSGGVKLMMTRNFGARFELRTLALFSGGSLKGLCQFSECNVGLTGWGTLQVDLSIGTLFSF